MQKFNWRKINKLDKTDLADNLMQNWYDTSSRMVEKLWTMEGVSPTPQID